MAEAEEKIYLERDGQTYAFPASSAAKAFAQGFVPESEQSASDRKYKELTSGVGGSLLALGMGAIEGVSVGLSNVGAKLVDDSAQVARFSKPVRPVSQLIQGVKKAAPTATLVGNITGAVGATLLSAGAAAPAALISAGGTRISALVAAKLGQGAAARIAGYTAGGLAEGALSAASYALGEAALENRDVDLLRYETGQAALENKALTADKLLAHIGIGALFGAAGGAVLSSAGEGVRASMVKAKGLFDVVGGQSGKVQLPKKVVDLMSAMSGADKGSISKFTALGEEGMLARRAVVEGEQLREGATRGLVGVINSSGDNLNDVSLLTQGKMKKSFVRENVRTQNPKEAIDSAVFLIDKHTQKLKSMLEEPGEFGDINALKKALKMAESTKKKISALGGDNPSLQQVGESFYYLDSLKRRYQKFAKPGAANRSEEATMMHFRDYFYESIRLNLEDTARYGYAAKVQQKNNSLWTKYLGNAQVFSKNFMTKVGTKDWQDIYQANPESVSGYIGAHSRAANDLRHQSLVTHMNAEADLIESLAETYSLDPSFIARSKSNRVEFNRIMGDLDTKISLANEFKELQKTSNNLGGVVGGLGGAALAGPVGAVAGATLAAITNPAGLARRLIAVERAAAPASQRIANAIAGFVDSSKKFQSVARTGSNTAFNVVNIFSGEKDEDKRMAQFSAVASDPIVLARKAAEATSALGVDADLAPVLAERAANAAKYLADSVPAMNTETGGMRSPAKLSEFAKAKFQEIERAVDDPASIAEAFAEKKLTHEQVRAVSTLYPELYAEMIAAVSEQVAIMRRPMTALERSQFQILTKQNIRNLPSPVYSGAKQTQNRKTPRYEPNGSSELTRAQQLSQR